MTVFQRIGAFFKRLNIHDVAHLGAGMIGLGGAAQVPQFQSALDLFHDGGKTKATVNGVAIGLIGLGTFLCGATVGRSSDTPQPPVAPHP